MTKLAWATGDLESGLYRGVLYPEGPGVAWNGLVYVEEKPETQGDTSLYFDGKTYCVAQSSVEFEASIAAFSYPPELYPYETTDSQTRQRFGLSYTTRKGDIRLIHLVYNAIASPTIVQRKTVVGSPTTDPFTWDISATPGKVIRGRPCAHFVIDTNAANADILATLEGWLYGTEFTDPRLPSIPELLELFGVEEILIITDNGDGTWTAEGPDHMVYLLMTDNTIFEINSPSAIFMSETMYTVSTY